MADAERRQVGDERRRVAKGEVAMKLQAIGRADRRRVAGPGAHAAADSRRSSPISAASRRNSLPPMTSSRVWPSRRRQFGWAVGGARQVRLLGFADQILDLHQHQPGMRARQIALDRVAECGPIDRLAGFRQEPAAILGRQQSLRDQRVEQQVAVAGALGRLRDHGIVIGIKPQLPAPGDVAAEPKPFERGEVVGRHRRRGERRIISRRDKPAVAAPLERHDAIGQHICRPHRFTEPRRHGAEILADHGAGLPPAFESDEPQQVVERIVDVAAFGRRHAFRDPIEAVQRHDMVDAQDTGVAHVGAQAGDKGLRSAGGATPSG